MALRSNVITGNSASIDFSDTDDWGTGFIGSIAITNTSGESLNGWTLTFDLAENITNIWNAVIVSHVGSQYVIANASWDATVANGGTVSFGFQADGGNPVLPTSYILNGTSIGSSSAPPPPPTPPPLPTLSIANASVTETGSGSETESFVVTLSAASTSAVTVQYSTADGTAHAGTDYTAESGTLTFAPGVTTETISVPTFAGAVGSENYTVQLSQPVGATLANAQATGTIVNPAPISNVAPWVATTIYTAGMEASEDNIVYRANWWTQGNDPADNNGGPGTGEPWTDIGTVAPITSVPTVPTGLTATTTTSTSVVLNWQAASIPGGGSATSYGVFENGQQIATVSTPDYVVGGLTPSTSYSFAVDAIDSVGSSAESTPLSVTTSAGSSGTNSGVFAPYIDMGLPQDANLLAIAQASGITTFTLAFIQSSGNGTIGWSGVGTIDDDTLSGGSTILSQVQQLQAAGDNVIISFGGAAGTDPATVATSAAQLQAEYQSVIDRYHVNSLDFDIEGAPEANQASLHLRDEAILGLKAANPGLTISFTLPVLPTGLDYNGLNVVQTAKADGLTPDVINIMAMDYGSSVDNGGQMGTDAIDAVTATQNQLQSLGMNSKLGVTPMIGVNDISSEVFTLQDAMQLADFAATDPDIARLSMWSVARDNGSMPNATYASDSASGIAQSQYQFSSIFQQFAAGSHG